MLRHGLATLAYRAAQGLHGAAPGFAEFAPGAGRRTAGQILAHLGDLMDWGTSIELGAQAWTTSPVQAWDAAARRFFDTVAAFDAALAATPPDDALAAQLFQGPLADALQHTGHLTMM